MSKIQNLKFEWASHQPNWKKPLRTKDQGFASLQFNSHVDADWLEIFATEGYVTEKGRLSSKDTMITLSGPQAIQLRDFLIANVKG
jgi:hypothetical protein